ncbi:ATP-binding protein [bacterium]|nr:MAG: ATP-binding protein [bacterium]
MAREPYRLFQPTIVATGLIGMLVWFGEFVWLQHIDDVAFVSTLMVFFLFSRALAFPPGTAIRGRRLPTADARFDLTMPALCALLAGAGPLALSTAVFIGYGLEIVTHRQRTDRAAFNAAKMAIAGLVAAFTAFGVLPRLWTPVDEPLRFAVLGASLALCDGVIALFVAAMRENRRPARMLVRGMRDAGVYWDVLGGLAGGYAIVYVHARLGVFATAALCIVLAALVWSERRAKVLTAELARVRAQLAALSIAEPLGDLARCTKDLFDDLRASLGLDLLALYAPVPGERALVLLAGTGGAPARIPLVAGSGGALERALAGQVVELDDFRATGETALAAGTERWRATLATPLETGGSVLAVLLATRTTPFLPGREARIHLRETAAQLADVLAMRLAAEERLRLRSQQIYRDVIAAATGGKLELLEREELERQLGALQIVASVAVRTPRDVRVARAATERTALASGLPPTRVHDLVLCVSETATNVLKHAGHGAVDLRSNGERLLACVSDAGPGIPFAQLPKATLMRGFSSKPSLGYGFTFLLEFLDHIELATGDWGTIVAMEVELHPREELDVLLAGYRAHEIGTFPGSVP